MTNESWAVGDDLPVLEEGVYDATCVRIEDTHSDLYDKDQLQLVFRIAGTENELSRWVTKPVGALRPKMTLYKIAEALLGRSLKEHGPLKRDDLLQQPCQLVVKVEAKDDGQINRIDSILKAKQQDFAPSVAQVNQVNSDSARLDEAVSRHGADAIFDAFDKASANDGLQVNNDGVPILNPVVPFPTQAKVKHVLKELGV